MKTKAGGIEINYELFGQGPCLVMIHGFGDNLTMWYNQVPEFSSRFKVLTYDVRGFGETAGFEEKFSMAVFADDLYHLIQSLDIRKANILGFSMGGRIGMEFALKYPDIVTTLTLANSGVGGGSGTASEKEKESSRQHMKQMFETFESRDINAIADSMTENAFSPGFREREPEAFQRYKEVKLRNDPEYYLTMMRSTGPDMVNTPDLASLKCPVLIIAGEHDRIMTKSTITYMEKMIPDVTVRILPTGHAAAIEDPEGFNRAVLDFLT